MKAENRQNNVFVCIHAKLLLRMLNLTCSTEQTHCPGVKEREEIEEVGVGGGVEAITCTDVVALPLLSEGPAALGAVGIRHTESCPSLPALPTGGRTHAPGRPLLSSWITCRGSEHAKLPYTERGCWCT